MTKHMVIPDTQVKPGVNTDHLEWAGQYAVEKKPDVIVHIGDHWDMPSLSSYDKGKKSAEGKRVLADIKAGNDAIDRFMAPIHKEIKRLRRGKRKVWNPRLVYCIGNHEQRIERAVNDDAMLEGLISYDNFNLKEHGFEVVPFLDPIVIDGIAYAHYFTSGVMGRPVASAQALLTKKHMSCVMGHVQHRAIAFAHRADGKPMTGLFAGTFYQHEEAYLNAQGNQHWHGLWMLHEVNDGSFDEMPVSMNYLRKKYGGK